MNFITSVQLTPTRLGHIDHYTVTVNGYAEYNGYDRARAAKVFNEYAKLFLAGIRAGEGTAAPRGGNAVRKGRHGIRA